MVWPWQKESQTQVVPPATQAKLPAPGVPNLPQGSLTDPAGYFSRYGYPMPIHDVETFENYVSCYDRRMRGPTWTIEHITPASRSEKKADRRHSLFRENTHIPALFRARLEDYFRSGYDRGHNVPAADASFSQKAMDSTFFLTNISPQVGQGFNRDYWAHFERFCRNLTYSYNSVRIVTGSLWLPKQEPDGKFRVSYEVIGSPPNVAVPTHFYKIAIAEDPILKQLPRNGVAVAAFVLPNTEIPNNQPLTSFEVPVEAIERAAGVEFMPKLPPAQRRQLCKEVTCAVDVVEFIDNVRQPKPRSLPPPSNA